MTAMRRDGHKFPVELTLWPIRVEGAYRFNAFVHDITERKQVEKIRQEKETLNIKSEFISMVSHNYLS